MQYEIRLIYEDQNRSSLKTMKYKTVARAIDGFGTFLSYSIAKIISIENPVEIAPKVRGIHKGSLDIPFLIDLPGLFASAEAAGLRPRQIFDLIRHFFDLFLHLKGRPSENVEVVGNMVKVTNILGITKDVNIHVHNHATLDPRCGDSVKKFILDPLNSRESGNIELIDQNDDTIHVNHKDAYCFNTPKDLKDSDDESEDTIETLRIDSVRFIDGNKWQFSKENVAFSAKISDEDFLNDVRSGKYRFGSGDELKVVLRTTKAKRPHHSILTVIEHFK